MDFNKIISLILGFVVLILIFVWLNNKFHLNGNETTSNVTPTITTTITPTKKEENTSQSWGPFSFLFDNNPTNTPTPTLTIAKGNIYGSPTPTSKILVKVIEGQKNSPNIQTTNVIVTNNNKDSNTNYKNTNEIEKATYSNTKTIPETGAESIFLPIALSAIAGGVYLLKKS